MRFYTKIALNSGEDDSFGCARVADGRVINFIVVEKNAVIKFDKHVVSRVFSPDELERLNGYMVKYRKYGIELLADVMDVEEAGVMDCFVQAGAGGVAPRTSIAASGFGD